MKNSCIFIFVCCVFIYTSAAPSFDAACHETIQEYINQVPRYLQAVKASLATPKDFRQAIDRMLEILPAGTKRSIKYVTPIVRMSMPSGQTPDQVTKEVDKGIKKWAENYQMARMLWEQISPKILPYVQEFIPESRGIISNIKSYTKPKYLIGK